MVTSLCRSSCVGGQVRVKTFLKQRLEGKGEVSIQSTFMSDFGPCVCVSGVRLFELLCSCISGSSRVQLPQQLDVHGFGSRIDGFSVPLPPPILIRREICCCAEFHVRWIVFDRGKCCFQILRPSWLMVCVPQLPWVCMQLHHV